MISATCKDSWCVVFVNPCQEPCRPAVVKNSWYLLKHCQGGQTRMFLKNNNNRWGQANTIPNHRVEPTTIDPTKEPTTLPYPRTTRTQQVPNLNLFSYLNLWKLKFWFVDIAFSFNSVFESCYYFCRAQLKSMSTPADAKLALIPFPPVQPPKKVVSKKIRLKTFSRLL